MIGFGALTLVGLVAMIVFVIKWTIVENRIMKEKEAWREDPNFKWNWD